MGPCVCGHLHLLACRQCRTENGFSGIGFEAAAGTDWYPGKDSYRYEAVQALRGDLSL